MVRVVEPRTVEDFLSHSRRTVVAVPLFHLVDLVGPTSGRVADNLLPSCSGGFGIAIGVQGESTSILGQLGRFVGCDRPETPNSCFQVGRRARGDALHAILERSRRG